MTSPAEISMEEIFSPKRVGEDRYEAPSMPLEGGAIYGGQLLMQVLNVAADTLPAPLPAHYLQSTFVAAGDATRPLEIHVRRVRDGKSTCQRHVEISQEGRTLLLASLSFQDVAEGYDHQLALPDVPAPESLAADPDNYIPFASPAGDFPWLILDCDMAGDSGAPIAAIWTRPRDPVPAGDLLHQMCFAFLSDATILQSAMQPHGLDWEASEIFVATMNHTIWFHRPVDVNDWLLLHGESPSTSHGRALAVANAYSSRGELFATVAQEGVVRPLKQQSKP
ncbi:MAG: hypothetical protein HKN19_10420 [Halioglobus sp.]|nr:hypothetical protein [Halioglobus sp.]